MRECNRSGELDLGRDLSESLFLLKKSSSSSTASIQVDFSPLGKPQCNQPSPSKTLPTFNTDRNYYTPSFILEVDQVRPVSFSKNTKKIYRFILISTIEKVCKYQNKKQNQYNLNLLQFVPKPSKNNSYCCVCKVPFDDYLTVTLTLFSILASLNTNISSKNQIINRKSRIYAKLSSYRKFKIEQLRKEEDQLNKKQDKLKNQNLPRVQVQDRLANKIVARIKLFLFKKQNDLLF